MTTTTITTITTPIDTKDTTSSLGENQNQTTYLTKSLRRISLHPSLTPYRRRVYRTLLSIPPGRWTTYSALATHLGSSARAVGTAMRSNPFAPEVPCHRVLGAGGALGGYKGVWSQRGKGARSTSVGGEGYGGGEGKGTGKGCEKEMEKRAILEREGVVFDVEGKARGVCFGEFVDLGDKRW